MSVLQVLIILISTWTCNGSKILRTKRNTQSLEELRKELRESQREKQKLENFHLKTVMKLTVSQLQNGDIDSASIEFAALKNRDELIEELVQSAYRNKKVQLHHLTAFVCQINGFTTGYVAMSALYQEMVKNNQPEEQEMIAMYYKTLQLADCKYFASQSSQLKNNILELKTDLEVKIMSPLVDDIKNRSFERPNQVVNRTKQLWNGEELFLSQLAKFYVTRMSSSSQCSNLLDFVRRLPSYKSMCHAYATIWQELGGDTLEALAVWSHASEIVKMAGNISDAQCTDIADSRPPAYVQTLDLDYQNYIEHGHTDKIRDLHARYYLRTWFAYYLGTRHLSELQNSNFNKMVDAIYALPYISDVCYAVAAVFTKFESEGMLGTFEHFQVLQIVKKMRDQASYAKIDPVSKFNCESAAENTPPLFHMFLYKDTTNCRLLNRHYVEEPLFCTNATRTEFGYRRIFSTSNRTIVKDQFWNLTVAENTHGIILRNKNHTKMSLRFIRDNVRGSDQPLDLSHDYFRIHTKDKNFFLLEPMNSK